MAPHFIVSPRVSPSPLLPLSARAQLGIASRVHRACWAFHALRALRIELTFIPNPPPITAPLATAKLLAARLGPEKPLSSHTVRVPTAFLSFDMRGLPFVEPCFCNALVQGVNDGEWPKGGEGERREEGEVYRKWVWERCCPGLEYTGELPPRLEVSAAWRGVGALRRWDRLFGAAPPFETAREIVHADLVFPHT